MSASGWIGVDLDGTLAMHARPNGWDGRDIGAPIPLMVARVKRWLEDGLTVKILTARVAWGDPGGFTSEIQAWCKEHVGQVLEVTAQKDFGMIELWDDRAIQIVMDTGRRADGLE